MDKGSKRCSNIISFILCVKKNILKFFRPNFKQFENNQKIMKKSPPQAEKKLKITSYYPCGTNWFDQKFVGTHPNYQLVPFGTNWFCQ